MLTSATLTSADTAENLMHAAVLDSPGAPDAFELREIPRPVTVNNEALVHVRAAGVNPIDAKTRAGGGTSAGIGSWPAVIGRDLAGEVVAPPYEMAPFKAGQHVYGIAAVPRSGGSDAQYAAVPITSLAPAPISLTHEEAAAVPAAAPTAWGAVVDLAKARSGKRILIHAAGGGVGHFAVQLAHYFGAYVIGTTSAENHAFVKRLGADKVIDYRERPFEEAIDRPVDVVIDLIGNRTDQTSTRSLAVLRRGGLIVNVPTGSWPSLKEEAAAAHVRASTFKLTPSGPILGVIGRLIDAGDIAVEVERIYSLAELPEAHRAIEDGHTRGKLVVRID